MQFVIGRNVLQKELAFVQGIVERKNTIPVLANILIESAGETSVRISGTDLDVTIRCESAADELDEQGVKMVTTDGHRLAFASTRETGEGFSGGSVDVLIPRKTLAELAKLASDFDGEISLGADENHVYFQVGSRLLISRMLSGQFPNYEMVMPKNNEQAAVFDTVALNQAVRRVALMADDRSHAVRLHLSKDQLLISSQNAEEGEARETVNTDFAGNETEIGFNAQYLQDFLNVVGSEKVVFEFKDGNSQAQMRPFDNNKHDYKYVLMPMRL